jgi:methionyl aminopeptidase
MSSFVDLKDDDWLTKQKIAGKVVAETLTLLENLVKEKTTKSLIELNEIAENYITQNDCSCTFKNYKGFPCGVCISVDNNKQHQLVHGIPTDYVLREHDIVKFDLGATYKGAIADSAITCIYGESKSEKHIELIKDTRDALLKGIESIKIGNHIGCIGNAIYKYGRAKNYGVILNYGGHGISWSVPHSQPFIANKANATDGIRVQKGLTVALEPMFCLGGTKTWVGDDKWTVNCESITAHFEHTVYIHEDKVEIITLRENEEVNINGQN